MYKKLKQLIDEEVSWKWVNGHVLAEKILSVIVVHCHSSFQGSVLDSIVLLSVCGDVSVSLQTSKTCLRYLRYGESNLLQLKIDCAM